MRKIVSQKENEYLKQLDSIDVEKELYPIMENPELYFDAYLKNIKGSASLIFAQFSILMTLRTIDTSEKLSKKSADHFMSKYPIEKWLSKLTNFYEYGLSIIDYIIENHDNSILDMYNEKQITKIQMEKGLIAFDKAKKQLAKDREDMVVCIAELEVEKEKARDFLD
jgi:hypothetical protein